MTIMVNAVGIMILEIQLDPNRDPNAEKSGGIIRAGNDEAAKFSEQKGAKMP